jgi:hypothetical protein
MNPNAAARGTVSAGGVDRPESHAREPKSFRTSYEATLRIWPAKADQKY